MKEEERKKSPKRFIFWNSLSSFDPDRKKRSLYMRPERDMSVVTGNLHFLIFGMKFMIVFCKRHLFGWILIKKEIIYL